MLSARLLAGDRDSPALAREKKTPLVHGGRRTNVEMTVNEVPDVCDVQGMHQTSFFGNHARERLRFRCLCR